MADDGRASKNTSRGLDYELTPEKVKKIKEMRDFYRGNLERFCEDFLFVLDREAAEVGSRLVPMKLAPSQLSLFELRRRVMDFNRRRSAALAEIDHKAKISSLPVKIICLKARKVMVSTAVQAIGYHQAEFNPGTKCLTLAHEAGAAKNIGDISKRFFENWSPNTDPPLKTPLVRASDELIEWKHDSSMVIQTAGGRSKGSSRSFTHYFLHLSEVAQYEDASAQLAAALTAAASYSEQYMESTARGENVFYTEWMRAMDLGEAERRLAANEAMPEDWTGYFRWFWAWWQDEAYRRALFPHEKVQLERTLEPDEIALRDRFGLSLEQLAWRRDKIRGDCSKQSEMSPRDYFKQEFPSSPEEAFVSKGLKAFPDREHLETMSARSEAIYAELVRGKRLQGVPFFHGNIVRNSDLEEGFALAPASYIEGSSFVQWTEPRVDRSYIIGGDAAEGLEHGDDSTFSVWDRGDGSSLSEVARYIGKADPEELAELIYFAHVLYNDAYVVMERNKPGNATCMRLVALGCANMYHHKSVELFKDRENPESFTAGFLTTPSTKPILVAAGIVALRDGILEIFSREALAQWRAYENINGVYGAPSGKKDDCVISDLLAIFGNRHAPPVWATRPPEATEVSEMELPPWTAPSTEADQSEYWRARIGTLKARAAERNRREAELRRGPRPVDESDIFGW